MVTTTGLCVLFLLNFGGTADHTPLSLQYWVVEGAVEGRETPAFDAGAQAVRDALEDLRFDTWHTVRRQTVRLAAGTDTRVPMKDRYTLILRYVDRDDDNRARVAVAVELAPKDPEEKPQKILQTTLLLSREKARIGGLRTQTGELVLVFAAQ